ncbi:MAG: hypothetical protein CVV44_11520 [Spirochaetae bacterium HGW-Spirochaetae-1]|nr:MAG: hypothetical protein CVV44_11520 [Spirochaetae bacterium HGW-Spirochaetae-1]
MAISRMTRVLIAGHLSQFEAFMRKLQLASLLHLTDISEEPPGETRDEVKKSFLGDLNPERFRELEEVKEFLERFRPEESFLKKLFTMPRLMGTDRFYNFIDSFDATALKERVLDIKKKMQALKGEQEELAQENERLGIWRHVSLPVFTPGEGGRAVIITGTLKSTYIPDLASADIMDYESLYEEDEAAAIVTACLVENLSSCRSLLRQWEFQELDTAGLGMSPREKYHENMLRIDAIEKELKSLAGEAGEMVKDYDNLLAVIEHYSNLERRGSVFRYWLTTANAFVLAGWIRTDDLPRLTMLVREFDSVNFEETEPGKGESPPVCFENMKLFSPFQLITRLYNYPAYSSLDPSAMTSFFFVIFFGLCLTDAGYGLILSLAALWALKKTRGQGDILWIALWGGLATIVLGLLTGGIFGDLFRSTNPFINAPALTAFRDRFTWFDPMLEPMVFFRLVLFLGLVQVLTGLVMGIYSNIRQGLWLDAVADNLSWLVIVSSLVTILFASDLCVQMALVPGDRPLFDSGLVRPAGIAAGIMALVVFFFGGRDEEKMFFRFFIGFLKLLVLSGVFSYLGDILSYIRLMALGMVTAGIGMAINTIAFMMTGIPVLGYVMAALILILGHLFNMAINLLGGFVHTLRLQYVEFFSKFFTGGGKAFTPLAYTDKYVKIIE